MLRTHRNRKVKGDHGAGTRESRIAGYKRWEMGKMGGVLSPRRGATCKSHPAVTPMKHNGDQQGTIALRI